MKNLTKGQTVWFVNDTTESGGTVVIREQKVVSMKGEWALLDNGYKYKADHLTTDLNMCPDYINGVPVIGGN